MPSLFTDDPVESMETAKAIIGGRLKADPAELVKIAGDKKTGPWQRIAAIYTLGFVGGEQVAAALRHVLSDRSEDDAVRAHAAEALGNIRDADSVMLLRDIIGQAPQPLRDSCKYALGELEAA